MDKIENFKKAISLSENLNQLEWVTEKLRKCKSIPTRRSKEGKRIRTEFEDIIYQKEQELIKNEKPF